MQTKVTTTTQGDIVIMLYDGAVNFLNQSKEYLSAGDMAKKGIAISKAMDIINELDSALNSEKGGTLAANLHGLYAFCTNHLLMANLKKSIPMIDEVIRILGGLRSAYAQILNTPEAVAAGEQAAAGIQHGKAPAASRGQAGIMPSGPAAPAQPAPAAGARMRAMYAKTAAQAAQVPAAPPVVKNEAVPPAAEAAAAPETEPAFPASDDAPEQSFTGFPPTTGFARPGAAAAYRKFGGV